MSGRYGAQNALGALLERKLVAELERDDPQAKQLGLPMAYRLTDDGFDVAGLVALEGVPHG